MTAPLRRLLAILAMSMLLAGSALVATGAAAARTSLPDVEQDVMCTVCGTPLALANSPEADRERAFILERIHAGETKAQIERDLVAQYGPAVLALPARHGFDLTIYIVPPLVLLLVAGALVVVVPRWRRRGVGSPNAADGSPNAVDPAAATSGADDADPPPPSAAEAHRLEQDLARYGG